jgi:hypothetical protein
MEVDDIKPDINAYVDEDDVLKEARVKSKQMREDMKMHAAKIIAWMKMKNTTTISLAKLNQVLLLKQRQIKVRPTGDQIKTKIMEMMKKGVNDPMLFYEEIQACGGTREEDKLSRRSTRPRAKAANPVRKKRIPEVLKK